MFEIDSGLVYVHSPSNCQNQDVSAQPCVQIQGTSVNKYATILRLYNEKHRMSESLTEESCLKSSYVPPCHDNIPCKPLFLSQV